MIRRGLVPLVACVVVVLSPALARADSSGRIVRFATSLGNIDVQLLPQAAPKTVANFLGYVTSGAYDTTFFHRSVPGFVLQGGGYNANGGQIKPIPQQPAVPNEFGVSNIRGTLAMAKLPSDPNSATNQWFFNLADNSASLDAQNGGFTVFGRVLSPASLAVMDAIAAQPVVNQLPVQNYTPGQTVTTANLIMSPITVLDDRTAPTISITQPTNGQQFTQGQSATPQFTCDDGTGTGVASCMASGPIETSPIGQHTFTVTASDYAGNTSSQSVSYEVVTAQSTTSPSKPSTTPATSASPVPALASSLTVSNAGAVSISLRCVGRTRCAGRATLYALEGSSAHSKHMKLGSAHYSIATGRHSELLLRLGRSALSLLRHGKGHLRVWLDFTPTGGKTRTTSTRLTLAGH